MSNITVAGERLHQIILAPVVSEKSTRVAEKRNQAVFKVLLDAKKPEIKEAVEKLAREGKLRDLPLPGGAFFCITMQRMPQLDLARPGQVHLATLRIDGALAVQHE